jgi:exopolyphosphatase/guanosine-5'-triphosphate,3'-diphosphate pyrophosphatase
MLIADIRAGGLLHVVHEEHEIARLGRGVDQEKKISRESIERALAILTHYKTISEWYDVNQIVACATSAVRDASNREEFLREIKKKIGITVSVINGKKEAELTYLGAVSGLFGADTGHSFAVLDIGGGSTELTIGKGRVPTTMLSVDMGCVRLTERVLKTSPPTRHAFKEAELLLDDAFKNYPQLDETTRLVGVAGTMTTLASLDLKLTSFDRHKLAGHNLTLMRVEQLLDELRFKNLDELRAYPQIHQDRADILLAGVLILVAVMRRVGAMKITVSDRGLRYGLALQAASSAKR